MSATLPRLKTYSAESGYVYQYYFLKSQPLRRVWGRGGLVFFFNVTSDRKNFFVIEVLVEDRAARAWQKLHGRELAETEKYAAAKMRLFRAFNEAASPEDLHPVTVNERNIEELLEPLRLDE